MSIIYAPIFGGPHNTLSMIAGPLKNQGVDTIVVLPDDAHAAAGRMRGAGVDVVTMPLHRMRMLPDLRVHAVWLKSLRRETRRIVDLIHDRGVDVVATNSLPNLQGGLAARRAGIACVWELIDSFPPPAARRLYMPLVLHLSDVVMTTGRKIAEGHPGTTRLGDRWVNFYPAVDVDNFRADPATRRHAREELGLSADGLVIGNVSNINPMKGHRYFIEAAARLLNSHPQTQFVILGGTYDERGDYYRDLWGSAERLGLRVGGNLVVRDPGDRVAQLAQSFDLFWMTSEPRSEGLPTVIGEAKALGLPVVTTDVGSTSECVTDGVSGYVVTPRDADAIAAATRRILADPNNLEEMGRRARSEAVRDYASQRTADAHRLAFERAIANHAASSRRGLLRLHRH